MNLPGENWCDCGELSVVLISPPNVRICFCNRAEQFVLYLHLFTSHKDFSSFQKLLDYLYPLLSSQRLTRKGDNSPLIKSVSLVTAWSKTSPWVCSNILWNKSSCCLTQLEFISFTDAPDLFLFSWWCASLTLLKYVASLSVLVATLRVLFSFQVPSEIPMLAILSTHGCFHPCGFDDWRLMVFIWVILWKSMSWQCSVMLLPTPN